MTSALSPGGCDRHTKCSPEEIPLIQGKEQRLHLAGAAVKRYPMPKGKRNPSKMVGVAGGHQRADTLKPYSLVQKVYGRGPALVDPG